MPYSSITTTPTHLTALPPHSSSRLSSKATASRSPTSIISATTHLPASESFPISTTTSMRTWPTPSGGGAISTPPKTTSIRSCQPTRNWFLSKSASTTGTTPSTSTSLSSMQSKKPATNSQEPTAEAFPSSSTQD